MRVLVVLAHPLPDSMAASIARTICETLTAGGNDVDFIDLYADDFDPRLSAAERSTYMTDQHDIPGVADYVARLKAAEALVLVFPQWWFNLPAILKGYIDRVFVPGVAFAADPAGGRLVPRLDNIRYFWAVTTTGSPWWIVHFYMGNPVRRILKRGIAAFCSKGLRFRMMSLHDMDRSTEARRRAFLERVRHAVRKIR